MKTNYLKASLFALAAMVACTEFEVIDEPQGSTGNGLLQELSITGKDFQFEDVTRSSVTIGENGASFTWNEDDVIGIFPDKGDQVSFAMEEGAGTQTATFSGGGWALKSSAKYAAYYPHVYENRDLTAIPVSYLGQTQNGNGNTDHIGAYDFMAAGVSTPENGAVAFDMQHLGALVQLTITVPEASTLSKVVLTSATEFTATGTIDLTVENPAITAQTQSNTLEIALNNVSTTAADENVIVYFMTAPIDLTDSELTATVHFAGDKTCKVELAGKNMQAGNAYRLTAEIEEEIPNNQIWYTSSDENVVTPSNPDAFEATITSNIYENGKGIITFDNDITKLGLGAFSACSSLSSIIIPNSVNYIGSISFDNCTSLSNIVLPEGVKTIGSSAFYNCTALSSIELPESVETIESSAFNNCTSLLSITIPKKVSLIGTSTFSKCTSLTSIVVDSENSTYDSRNNCNAIIHTATNRLDYGCTNTTIPSGVTSINASAFAHCTNLTVITIPNSVTEIGANAFENCTSLSSITIPDSVTKIGSKTFEGCTSLQSIIVPKDIAIIEAYTFKNCTSLSTVVLPDNLLKILDQAFAGCSSITELSLPNTLNIIASYAFADCSKLSNVEVNALTPPTLYGNTIFYNCSSDLTIYVHAGSLETYKTTNYWKNLNILPLPIPNNQIWYTSSDGDIITPLTTNEYAGDFGASIISNTYENGIGIITFDGPVTSIGRRTFIDKWTLTSMIIPNSVTTIDNAAFSSCSNLSNINMPDNVTKIGDNAFFSCEKLANVTIGNSVNSIGSCAFYGCESLATIAIPNSVISIGYSAFNGCSNLTDVTIGENVTEIGDGAFSLCEKLTSVTIPNSVTTIGNNPFYQCLSLKSFKGKYSEDNGKALINGNKLIAYANLSGTTYSVPNNVTEIGRSAFYCCLNLREVTLPNSLISIGEASFYECTDLESIIIPDSVIRIEDSAFCYCDNLLDVTIPKNVTEIGDYAFHGCRNRNTVHCEAETPPTIGYDTFSGCSNNMKVYVPTASLNSYKTANYWKKLNLLSE